MKKSYAIAAAMAALAVGAPRAQTTDGVKTFDAVWTIVRDTHFDKSLNGVDWEAVRKELRPQAEAAKSDPELRGVLRDMLKRLRQSHFTIVPASVDRERDGTPSPSGSAEPAFDVRLAGNELLVTAVDPKGTAAAAGVKMGWRLAAIGDVKVANVLHRLPADMEERLRQVEVWRAAVSRLRGPAGSRVALTFEDEHNKPVVLSVERQAETGQPVTVGSLPTMFVRVDWRRQSISAGRVAGVIRFNVWMAAVDAQFQKAVDELRDTDGIVIDLRGNPGGLAGMMMGISGHFVGDVRPLGFMKTRDNTLHFNTNPRLVNSRGERVEPFGGPVAILVDALTGSASECFTGGMQSIKRARVFGQISMGQALPSLFDRLPNGDVLIHAYADFVTADGTRLEGRGVVPDEPVVLSREHLLAGRDRTLEAALSWIERTQDR